MRAYIVTAGEYSDYHIEKVFTDPVAAQTYANMDDDRRVEEFPVDDVQITDVQEFIVNVTYDFSMDRIKSMTQVEHEWNAYDPGIGDDWYTTFRFSVHVSGRLLHDIAKDGMKSQMLARIAQDKFYAELDRIGKSKQELLKEKQKKHDEYTSWYNRRFPTYTTSSVFSNPIEQVATQEVTDRINEMYECGEKLPDALTVLKMIQESRNKND